MNGMLNEIFLIPIEIYGTIENKMQRERKLKIERYIVLKNYLKSFQYNEKTLAIGTARLLLARDCTIFINWHVPRIMNFVKPSDPILKK